MTDLELEALTEELSTYNSRLQAVNLADSRMTVDVDGSFISEWRLDAFLHRFSIPFQKIVFWYVTEGGVLACRGRYWASFKL
ncbi:hypothetical protein WBJ53_17785 [Spirosoma sp. SC4-14]|uniref:hypothetical protein n=1 Tax=Spirosoma sp. SC4-14 TaxID=3128900 RepID=UPI0030D20108